MRWEDKQKEYEEKIRTAIERHIENNLCSWMQIFEMYGWTESLLREYSCYFSDWEWKLLTIYMPQLFSKNFAREIKHHFTNEHEDLYYRGQKI